MIPRQMLLCLIFALSSIASAQQEAPHSEPEKAQQLFTLANQARADVAESPLEWDGALADAALKHCQRMAVEGPISHKYPGEPDLTLRAGSVGAHFSAIEENIAVGSFLSTIHQGWMDSAEHRANLLNPTVNRVGIAVVAAQGVIFAVADYATAVPVLTQTQVESAFGALLRARNIQVDAETADARSYCNSSGHYRGNNPPTFLMRWQNPDVVHLPQQLLDELANGRYHRAAVGSCPAEDVKGAFTVYRVAVLLY
jgi:uncharacterized protein YkwD